MEPEMDVQIWCEEYVKNQTMSMMVNGTWGVHPDPSIWSEMDYVSGFKLFAYIVIITGGLLGNVSVILTVWLNRSMRNTTNYYVANLAVSDALICIFCMVPEALELVTQDYIFLLGDFMCSFTPFTQLDQEAFVTCSTNDTYALGALVLAHSLKNVQTSRKLAILITPQVSDKIKTLLGNVYDVVKVVDVLDSKDEANLAILTRPDLGVTFTKFHCWRLTQFQKCVFLDADTLVVKNCDELFEKEELSAVPDVGWPDCFNSGVFVYRPSEETFKAIICFAVKNGSFDGGDQGVLNMFFKDWRTSDISKHLSFIYNMNANVTYSYLPAYKQFGKDVKIVHFLGVVKPWMQSYSADTGRVQPDSPHSQEHLQMWWDTFMKYVQPNLSDECCGLAGELSKIHLGPSGATFAASSEARRFAWERGQIDYMGIDAFSNIEKKLESSINDKK